MENIFDKNESIVYKYIFEHANDIMLLLSQEGKVLQANKKAIDEYGYSYEELLNMSIFDLRNKEKVHYAKDQFSIAKSYGLEFRTVHYRKDGSTFPVEVKSIGITINNVEVAISIIRNISARIRNEEEIRNLAYLVENSNDAIISIDLQGNIMSWNLGAELLYGYDKDYIMGKHISIIIPEEFMDEFSTMINKMKIGEKIKNYEVLRKNKYNKLINVSISESPIYDIEGNLIGISVIARNLTEYIQNTKLINKLSTAVENSSSAIIITDYDGNIEYVNKKFELMNGYSKEEILGKNPGILKSGDQDKEFYKKMWKTIKSGKEWIGEFCNKKKDGSIYWCSASISPVKDPNGNITNFLSVVENITERKLLIENLNKKNEELENTLKLLKETEMKLIQEDKMASIGQLSAGIAHEINNPLGFVYSNFNTLKKYVNRFVEYITEFNKFKSAVMEGYSNHLLTEIQGVNDIEKKNKINYIIEDLEELFKDTDDGIDRIKNIVMALKNFAHEDNNDSYENYSLNEGISNTLIIVRNELKYTTEVETNLLEDIPLIRAKANEINQVLLNVLVNSSYAIKEKMDKVNDVKGKIRIYSWKDEAFVYCAIEDNGIGIPEENYTKIFNPFFTTKPVGKGTGLGLSISYDIIVKKHKGDIKIESKLGEGTKITIALPINEK